MERMDVIEEYLVVTEVIDWQHPDIISKASELSQGIDDNVKIAKRCFVFVRDEIRHSGDHKDNITTCKASEVLQNQTGWCYAKSHLLAALLRANGIPAGLCYQRLSCSEYEKGIYCLHGLNAIYLEPYGWYRIDARGNKEGVDAQFMPPVEKLAFEPGANEYDLSGIYAEPLEEVIKALRENDSYEKMITNFPDCKERL